MARSKKRVTIYVNKIAGMRSSHRSRIPTKNEGGPFNRFASPLVHAIRYADARTRLRYTLSGSTDL